MEELGLFILTFIVVFIVYLLFIVRKAKKKTRGSLKEVKMPSEVIYLERKYNINVDKSNYKKILNLIALMSSFDIALIVSLIMLVNIFVLQILLAMILSPLVFLGSYHLLGIYLKSGGK